MLNLDAFQPTRSEVWRFSSLKPPAQAGLLCRNSKTLFLIHSLRSNQASLHSHAQAREPS